MASAGQILELEGDGIADLGEAGQHVAGRHKAPPSGSGVTWKAGASVVVIIDRGLQPQPRRRQRQHAAQLAAADNADDAARRDGLVEAS